MRAFAGALSPARGSRSQAASGSAPARASLSSLLLWVGLTAVAGAVNAGAYLCCRSFVSHVTGTMTMLGVDFGAWALAFDYGLVFACFVGGAAVSVVIIDAWCAGKKHGWAVPVLGVVAILAFVAVAGRSGMFGAFGGSVEEPTDFLQLSLLSFSMGLLNAAAMRTGSTQRVTHLTGESTDLGMLLAAAFTRVGEERRKALLDASVRAAKIAAFVLGAAAMAVVARKVGYLAFLAPAGIAGLAASWALLAERRARPVVAPSVEPGSRASLVAPAASTVHPRRRRSDRDDASISLN